MKAQNLDGFITGNKFSRLLHAKSLNMPRTAENATVASSCLSCAAQAPQPPHGDIAYLSRLIFLYLHLFYLNSR